MAKRSAAPKYQPEDNWEHAARRFDERVEARLLQLQGYIVRRWPNLGERLGLSGHGGDAGDA